MSKGKVVGKALEDSKKGGYVEMSFDKKARKLMSWSGRKQLKQIIEILAPKIKWTWFRKRLYDTSRFRSSGMFQVGVLVKCKGCGKQMTLRHVGHMSPGKKTSEGKREVNFYCDNIFCCIMFVNDFMG